MKHTVCQGDREQRKGRALGTASPCYRAVPLLKHFKTVQPAGPLLVSNGYLTFDFPLQLGLNLHLGTLVSTIHLPRGFVLKAGSDISSSELLLCNLLPWAYPYSTPQLT